MNGDILGAAAALRTLLAGHTQDTRLLRLTTSLGKDALLVESFRGTEGLSQCFRFEIIALSANAAVDGRKLLGQPALLEILTQHSRSEPRPVHGHITAFESLSSDGGFARYRIRLEPWMAVLRHRHDCFVWQDKSTLDIVSEIFSDYQGQSALAPDWRLALENPAQYVSREVCTQFEESDLAFVERLLAEEGLFYWFEHIGDVASATLGSHRLVIADSNAAFSPNPQEQIRFHRAAAVESSDTITSWQATRRIMSNTMAVSSWNERQVSVISHQQASSHDNGDVPELPVIDHSGLRHFEFSGQAERAARIQLEALEARNKIYRGEGTVRTLAPGSIFVLTEHPVHEMDRQSGGDVAATFAVIAIQHAGRNNLSSEARRLIGKVFANSEKAARQGDDVKRDRNQDVSLYGNRFSALRADIPWRPLMADARGALLHSKPTVTGVHTAIVVGTRGQVLTTERDHRIKVQMHWQRGAQSASRRSHPQGENAPGNESAYVWVRVAEPAAGSNWGSSFIPRVGQEVILDYIEGDIDRPIVVGSLYNGSGLDDAQGNRNAQGAGAATGNAPAWFAGENGEHAHNAILSGFKTQEIGHSQDGQGGYNALVFDDSTNQVGARLQTTKTKAQLNLGHIKRQTDNARRQSHGHGAELTTEAFGAVRAGQGLLLSADARPNASSTQMDTKEAQAQLQQAYELQQSLAAVAQKHRAFIGKTFNQEQHESPEKILQRSMESLAQTEQGIIGTAEGGGSGTVPVFGRPDLVMSAPGGVALLTPANHHASASAMTIAGGLDVSATVGRNYVAAVRSGISLFTYGDAKAKRKEQGDKGIKLHAAQGKVDVQAQGGEVKVAADKDVNITSTQEKVEAAAKEHVLLTAGGAYIKIAGGSIQIHAPGVVQFKAGMKELSGPAGEQYAMPELPFGMMQSTKFVIERLYHDSEPLAGAPFEAVFPNGEKRIGKLDGAGRATLDNVPSGSAEIRFGAMPGEYARKDMRPTPDHKPRPTKNDIDVLIEKYTGQKNSAGENA